MYTHSNQVVKIYTRSRSRDTQTCSNIFVPVVTMFQPAIELTLALAVTPAAGADFSRYIFNKRATTCILKS